MIQTSYLTPPMAPAIFYLRGVSPPEMKLNTMYKGVIPFVGIQVVALAIVMIFPDLVTWLPEKLLGFENQLLKEYYKKYGKRRNFKVKS